MSLNDDLKRFVLMFHNNQDLTLSRIVKAVFRRLKYIPHRIQWYLKPKQFNFSLNEIHKFHNLHSGKRCFVIGNGPSLNKMNLSLLKNEYTFAMNRFYLMYEKLDFECTYHVVTNDLVINQFTPELIRLKMPKFFPWSRREVFKNSKSTYFFKESFSEVFAKNFNQSFGNGGTVTYTCLQLAYIMGFNEVYLIGVDHNFVEKGSGKVVTSQGKDLNHFHPDYFGKGVKWGLPNLFQSERGYLIAKEIFEKDGRVIKDATIDGHLNIFEKTEFASLFKST